LCHLKERRKKFRIYRCHPVYVFSLKTTVSQAIWKIKSGLIDIDGAWRQAYLKTDRQTGKYKERQADRLYDRQTDRLYDIS
jgi:hypothetical protein